MGKEALVKSLPHGRIFEIHFPKSISAEIRKKIANELLAQRFKNFAQHGAPEHEEGDVYLIHASFDEEKLIKKASRSIKAKLVNAVYQLKMRGLSVEEMAKRNSNRRSV